MAQNDTHVALIILTTQMWVRGGGGGYWCINLFGTNFVFLRLWRPHPFLQKTKGPTRNPGSPTPPPPSADVHVPPPPQSNFQVAFCPALHFLNTTSVAFDLHATTSIFLFSRMWKMSIRIDNRMALLGHAPSIVASYEQAQPLWGKSFCPRPLSPHIQSIIQR